MISLVWIFQIIFDVAALVGLYYLISARKTGAPKVSKQSQQTALPLPLASEEFPQVKTKVPLPSTFDPSDLFQIPSLKLLEKRSCELVQSLDLDFKSALNYQLQ